MKVHANVLKVLPWGFNAECVSFCVFVSQYLQLQHVSSGVVMVETSTAGLRVFTCRNKFSSMVTAAGTLQNMDCIILLLITFGKSQQFAIYSFAMKNTIMTALNVINISAT